MHLDPATADLLQHARPLLLALLRNRHAGVYVRVDADFSHVDAAFAGLFGYRPDELCAGLGLLDLADADDRARLRAELARGGADEASALRIDLRARRRDGSRCVVRLLDIGARPGTRTPAIGLALGLDEADSTDARHFVRQLIDTVPNPVFYKDRQGRYLGANRAFEQLTGHPVDAVLGRTVHALYPAAIAQRYAADDEALFAHPGHRMLEREVPHADGSRRAVVFSKATFERVDGSIGGLIGVILDVSERKARERALNDMHARLALAVEAAQLALWDLDIATDRVRLDHRWATMIGLPPQDITVAGGALLARVHPDDLPQTVRAAVALLKGDAPGFDRELRVRTEDGRWIWIRCTGRVIERNAAGRALRALGSNQDITAHKAAEQQIVHAAFHDFLTGLPNRYALTRHLDQALARAARLGSMVALCMFDLDDFKGVNDRHGHETGDRLLRELAERLRALVREADFPARLGGDEFVIVIADLQQASAATEMDALLSRVHSAVEPPFDAAGQPVQVGMSGGLALYPLDAQDADALLREADVAMYQSKQHKLDRSRWWRTRSCREEWVAEPDPAPDAFSARAAELLARHRALLDSVLDAHAAAFFDPATFDAGRKALFATLNDAELQRLRVAQRSNLAALLDGAADADRVCGEAMRIGFAHALMGVSASVLVQAVDQLRALVGEHLNKASMLARDRHRLHQVIDSRLRLQLRAQLGALDMAQAQYVGLLSDTLPPHGTLWADVVADEIAQLGALAGVRGVTLMRLGPNGAFAVESSAGPVGETIAEVLQRPESEAVVDPQSPRGQGLSAVAWRSGEICSSPSYTNDPRYAAWRGRAAELGLRSTLSVPLRDAGGAMVAVLSFFGAYPNQFESASMRQFARGLQQRWEQLWSRSTTPAPVMPQQRARQLRERLFAGGFVLHLQPVVDLRSGRLVKLEGLGRLCMGDELIGPGLFLPLLGDAELDHLFRLGLDHVLAALVALEADGLQVDVSINMAPSTLLDADCPRWVDDALRRHGVAPQRLHLELLESAELDPSAQDEAVERLVRVGVKLAMDDLGAGYSSLQRLSALPFDLIKIDQSLILNLRRAPLRSLPLIRSLIQLARDLDRQVVVEGLEDPGMIEAALALGAESGQGYGIARPMPLDAVAAWHSGYAAAPANAPPRSYLGALAHQWLLTQRDAPADERAVAAFLRGCADPEAAQWLQRLDAAIDSGSTRQALLRWLVERATRE